MIKIVINILFFLLATGSAFAQVDRSVMPKPGPAPEIKVGNYEYFQLKNGLKVIVVENHKLPRVSFSLIIDRDPILEKDKVGYISMAGEMLRRGTRNRTKDQIDEQVDFIGATLATGGNSIYASSLTKHMDVLLDLMTDILYNPVFPQEELDKIKKQTISALASEKDDPDAIAQNVAHVVLYTRDHPYGEIQEEEDVNNIARHDLVNYYDTYFKPNISYLAIVGDIGIKDARKAAKKYFAKWKKGEVPEHTYKIPKAPEENVVALVNRSSAVQTVLSLTYPVVLPKGVPDVIKASVMNQILGGSSSSRLFKNIREDKAYTYGAYSSISSDELVGNFRAGASVRNEVTDSTINEFIYEFNRIRNTEVDEAELSRAKNELVGRFGRSLESPQTVASYAISIYRYNLPQDYYDNYVNNVDHVTREEVRQMADKYIEPEHLNIVAVGKAGEIADKLKEYGPIQYYDTYGNKIDPSKAVIPPGMNATVVINNYLKAIGGKDRLRKIKTLHYDMEADVMGNKLEMQIFKKEPNKSHVEVKMGGNVVSEQIFNGKDARIMRMGNPVPTDEKVVEQLKIEGYPFPEMQYTQEDVKTELIGMEDINGKNAFAVEITYPSGESVINYYDTRTWYKIRQTRSVDTPQGKTEISTDFGEFASEDGIIFPHMFKIPVGQGMQMNAEVKSLELNTEIGDDLFQLE